MVQKLTIAVILFITLNSASAKETPVGFLTKVKGKVLLVNMKTNKEKKAKKGTKIYIHNAIQTLRKSKAKLVFKNGTIINIAEKTLFEIESYLAKGDKGSDDSSFKLLYGKIRSIVNPKQSKKMKVQTPAAVMGIRGTDFYATFDRKFKSGTTSSSVYTLSGKVALKRIYDGDEKEVMVTPGTYSTITAHKDGSISMPTEVKKTPPEIIQELEDDMLRISREEEKISPPKNMFMNMLDKALNSSKGAVKPKEDKEPEIVLNDNTHVEEPTTVAAAPKPEPKVDVKKVQVKKVQVEEIKPEKTPEPKNKVTVKRVAMAPKKITPKKKKKIANLYKNRFDLNTWAQFSDWMIVNDIVKKNGNKSLVRIIRHSKIDSKSKKKTKLTTLDATFYDGTVVNKKLVPSKNVEKLTTRVFEKNKKYKGAEIEFYVEPGSYLLSIDNGPTTKVTFDPQKDVTIKASAFISPGSNYYIYQTLTKTLAPMRSEGNPIFVLPSSYKIAKDVKNANGVVTGQKKIRTFAIGGDSIVVPEF